MQQFDESRARAPAVYYPNNLGISTPGSTSTFSFLVDGKSENGSEIVLILEELLKRGTKILSQTSWVYEGLGEFTLSVICDLKDSKETPDDFVIKFRGMRFVKNAKVVSLKRRMFSGLLFPLTMMDTSRVVALNTEAIFRVQDHLKTHAQKSDLVDAGRDVGKDIVRQIREKFESSDSTTVPNLDQVLKDNVVGFMSASGWGKFRWEQNNNAQRVLIQDPPTVSYGGTAAGNYFLQGMVAGLTEGFFRRKYTVADDQYDSELRLLSLSLLEQGVMGIGQSAQQNDQVSNLDKAVVLKEVEKIIQSVEKSSSAPEIDKTKEIETGNIAVSQPRKEETALVAPAIATGNLLQLSTGNKNKFALNTMEKGTPVVPNSQPEVLNLESTRTQEIMQSDQDQSQFQTQRRKTRRRTELSPLGKDKEEISDTRDKSMYSNSDSGKHEDVVYPPEKADFKKKSETNISNEKFEESSTTTNSQEGKIRDNNAKVEATDRDNTENRFEGATSPGQVTHVKRNTVVIKNGSEDNGDVDFSLSAEDELYYGESFD